MEEGHPHAFPLRAPHGEDAEIAAGQLEHGVTRRRHVGAVGGERAHVLHRELVRQIVAAPAYRVEGMRGVHAPRVDVVHLGDDLEAARLVARVQRAREPVVALAMGEEAPGGGRLALLRITGEGLVHPVVLGPRPEREAMRDALGHDEEIALAVLDGPEGGLERAPALMHEVDERGRVVLEEVVHRGGGRGEVHRHRGIGHQPRHPSIDVARRRRFRHGERVMRAAHRPHRRLPVRRPGARRPARAPPTRSSWWAGTGDRCGSPSRRSRRARAPARRCA